MKIKQSLYALMRWLGLGALVLSLAACLKFGPVAPVPQQRYMIKQLPVATSTAQAKPRAITLLVAPMMGNLAYNTTKMLYANAPYQIKAFAYAQWADLPTHMLQTLLVESLQQSQHYRAVVAPPFAGVYQQQLNTTLLYLAQEAAPGQAPQVQVSILAAWVEVASGKILAMKKFTVAEPVSEATPYGNVVAVNQACAKLLEQLVNFASNSDAIVE